MEIGLYIGIAFIVIGLIGLYAIKAIENANKEKELREKKLEEAKATKKHQPKRKNSFSYSDCRCVEDSDLVAMYTFALATGDDVTKLKEEMTRRGLVPEVRPDSGVVVVHRKPEKK